MITSVVHYHYYYHLDGHSSFFYFLSVQQNRSSKINMNQNKIIRKEKKKRKVFLFHARLCVYDVIAYVAEIGKSSLLCTCRCCRIRITC
jgi:hypothetical protein